MEQNRPYTVFWQRFDIILGLLNFSSESGRERTQTGVSPAPAASIERRQTYLLQIVRGTSIGVVHDMTSRCAPAAFEPVQPRCDIELDSRALRERR